MPFLRAKFGVTTITIMTALADGGLLTEGLKKKFFDKKLAKTNILVQFTTERQDSDDNNMMAADAGEEEEEDMINIRKFHSVKVFMEGVSSLNTVLENIESFSNEIR